VQPAQLQEVDFDSASDWQMGRTAHRLEHCSRLVLLAVKNAQPDSTLLQLRGNSSKVRRTWQILVVFGVVQLKLLIAKIIVAHGSDVRSAICWS
jgi:hypothetical protein